MRIVASGATIFNRGMTVLESTSASTASNNCTGSAERSQAEAHLPAKKAIASVPRESIPREGLTNAPCRNEAP